MTVDGQTTTRTIIRTFIWDNIGAWEVIQFSSCSEDYPTCGKCSITYRRKIKYKEKNKDTNVDLGSGRASQDKKFEEPCSTIHPLSCNSDLLSVDPTSCTVKHDAVDKEYTTEAPATLSEITKMVEAITFKKD